jgi:uncharacterized protein (TIGR03032 family)
VTTATAPGRYLHSTSFPGLLDELGVSLLISSYQAGKLVLVRALEGQLSSLIRTFHQPMGLAYDGCQLAVGARSVISFWQDAPALAPQFEPAGRHDACFVPRSNHVTGNVQVHEMAWLNGELWFVNTRFSCLCTLHPGFSFVPRWRPPFVSALAAEDRCHLKGMAVADGQPQFVTTLGATDTTEGWRIGKAQGGCLVEVASGEVVIGGLCMPHSPRLENGRLWVLDSGMGHLSMVDPRAGRIETAAVLPGYTRGLAFCGRYAFVGLSRIRETSQFGGLPIAEQRADLKCGIWVVDLSSAQTVGFLDFEDGIEEIFDIQVLHGVRFPFFVGIQQDTVHDVFVLPPEGVVP